MIARRSFLVGLGAAFAAPAIVRAASIMPVKAIEPLYGIAPSAWMLEEMRRMNALNALLLREWEHTGQQLGRGLNDLASLWPRPVLRPYTGPVPDLVRPR